MEREGFSSSCVSTGYRKLAMPHSQSLCQQPHDAAMRIRAPATQPTTTSYQSCMQIMAAAFLHSQPGCMPRHGAAVKHRH